jgi:hypothetical protein
MDVRCGFLYTELIYSKKECNLLHLFAKKIIPGLMNFSYCLLYFS